MPRRLPPLNALRAFEAGARHESFTRAAEELCVTQGAVSHQVKALESELGLKLFNRERQRLVITESGRNYLEVVRDALDRIESGTERLLQRQSAGALTVSTSPNFAAKWLVHRLGRFAEAHPTLTCGSAPPYITSTSPARMSIWASGMVMEWNQGYT
jgi:LysR family glycine cleavage system transcriptional activator